MIVFLLVMIPILISCGPPTVDVDADYVLVGFDDNSTITLDKGTTEFEDIADEAMRLYQHVGSPTECYFGLKEIEAIKLDNKFVEIGFDEAVGVL